MCFNDLIYAKLILSLYEVVSGNGHQALHGRNPLSSEHNCQISNSVHSFYVVIFLAHELI